MLTSVETLSILISFMLPKMMLDQKIDLMVTVYHHHNHNLAHYHNGHHHHCHHNRNQGDDDYQARIAAMAANWTPSTVHGWPRWPAQWIWLAWWSFMMVMMMVIIIMIHIMMIMTSTIHMIIWYDHMLISPTVKDNSSLPLLQTSRHEERYTKEAPQTCMY